THVRPRSLILTPRDGSRVALGRQRIAGVAWSGEGALVRVEVAIDGAHVREAEFVSAEEPHAWRRWECAWDATAPGAHVLESRAIDSGGHTQPPEPEGTRYGYANNAIESIIVHVG